MAKVHSRETGPIYSVGDIQHKGHAPQVDQLKHYPIDPKQDKVVLKVTKLADRVFRLSERVSSVLAVFLFPIKCLVTFVSNLFKAKKTEEISSSISSNISLSLDGTQKIAMDSKFYYAVDNGKILYKPIAASTEAPWKEFGNDGGYADKQHTPLVAVRADGDNVVAVDKDNHIHYAKSYSVDVSVALSTFSSSSLVNLVH